MEDLGIVERYPIIRTLAGFNPFAVLFESYRSVIYGTETGGPVPPDVVALGILLVASILFVGLAIIFFKRLEPNFAKVL
jgi:ABC-type polysaccharide/polyol phosphate export permease